MPSMHLNKVASMEDGGETSQRKELEEAPQEGGSTVATSLRQTREDYRLGWWVGSQKLQNKKSPRGSHKAAKSLQGWFITVSKEM